MMKKRQVIINDIVQKDKLSTREIWEKFALKEWIEKIEVITGFSGQVFSRRKFPKIDFIVYLMIIPFYLFIIIFNNRKLILGR